MITAENTSKTPEDEIDFKSIGSKIYSFCTYPFTLLFKNKVLALCFMVVAILFSITFKYVIPKTYTSSFILKPADVRDKIYLKILKDIPVLLHNSDKRSLSFLLDVDSLTLTKLVEVDILPSSIKQGDSTNTVEIKLEVSDNQVLLPLQTAIIRYLENNPYYTKIRTLQENQIDMSLKQINDDLLLLDSLKRIQLASYKQRTTVPSTQILLSDFIDPTAAYSASNERITKKAQLMAQTAFLARFQLVKSCVISSRHTWPPRILVLCLFTVPLSLILCSLFIHFRNK